MKRIITLLFIAGSLVSNAQKVHYSIGLDFNYPYIHSIEQDYPSYSTSTGYYRITYPLYKENFEEKLGGKIEGNISFTILNNVSVETGLQFNLIRYKRNIELKSPYTDQTDGFFISDSTLFGDIIFGDSLRPIVGSPIIIPNNTNQDKLGKSTILYTQIPVYVSYALLNQKLKLKLGLTASFLTYSEIYIHDISESYYLHSSVVKDKSSDGLTNLIWNGSLEVEYLLYQRVGLNINYSRSLNSIYDENHSVGKPRYNIFSIGLTYNIL